MKLPCLEKGSVFVLGIQGTCSGRNNVHWNQLPEPVVSLTVSVAMQRIVQIRRQHDVASAGIFQFLVLP